MFKHNILSIFHRSFTIANYKSISYIIYFLIHILYKIKFAKILGCELELDSE